MNVKKGILLFLKAIYKNNYSSVIIISIGRSFSKMADFQLRRASSFLTISVSSQIPMLPRRCHSLLTLLCLLARVFSTKPKSQAKIPLPICCSNISDRPPTKACSTLTLKASLLPILLFTLGYWKIGLLLN
jgi:hypothetical protein